MPRCWLQEENPKLQVPNPQKVPNPKLQTSAKRDHERFRNVSDQARRPLLKFGSSTARAIFQPAREFQFPDELIPVSFTPGRHSCRPACAAGAMARASPQAHRGQEGAACNSRASLASATPRRQACRRSLGHRFPGVPLFSHNNRVSFSTASALPDNSEMFRSSSGSLSWS